MASTEIRIIDDTSRRECDVTCGMDWSSPDTISLASQQIKARFNETTRLDYVDLSRTNPSGDVARWRDEIETKGLSVPLLLINGHLRIAGQFDTRQLIDAVDVEKELST